MKRMRNSVKAIIISICVAVVLAGSIVGVILGTRNRGNGGDPTTPTTPTNPLPVYELTEEQKQLVDSINKNANTTIKIATEFDESIYVYEDGSKIDLNNSITEINDEYLSFNDIKGSSILLSITDESNKNFYVDPFEKINHTKEIVYRDFIKLTDNYISYKYVYTVDGKYNIALEIFDISNLSNVKSIKSYEVTDVGSNFTEYYGWSYLNVINREDLFYFLIPNGDEDNFDFNIYVGSYLNLNEIKHYNIATSDFRRFEYKSNSYVIVDEGVYNFGYVIADGTLKTYSYENLDVSRIYFFDKYVFVEFEEPIERPEDKTETTINGVNYFYKTLNLENGEFADFKLDAGYARAEFGSYLENYIKIYEYKVDEDGEPTSGKFNYLNYNFEKIISYESASENNDIVYISGTNFLTTEGILSTKKSINAEYIKKFKTDDANFTLLDNVVNKETFIVKNKDSSLYYVMNIYGEIIVEEDFVSLVSYDNGFYFGQVNITGEYVIIDTNTLKITKLDKIADEEQYKYFKDYKLGCYLVDNEDYSGFLLYDYKGNILLEDVNDVSFEKLTNITIINIITDDGVVKYSYYDKILPDDDGEGFELGEDDFEISEDNIELYDEWFESDTKSFADGTVSVKFESKLGSKENGFRATATLTAGYILGTNAWPSFFIVAKNATVYSYPVKWYDNSNVDNPNDWNAEEVEATSVLGISKGHDDWGALEDDDGAEGKITTDDRTISNGVYVYTVYGVSTNNKGEENHINMEGFFTKVGKTSTMFFETRKVPYRVYAYNSNQYWFNGALIDSYDSHSGSQVDLGIPEQVGFTFNGWYTTDYATLKSQDGKITHSPATIDTFSYRAKFTANTYSIEYELNGGDEDQFDKSDSGVSNPQSRTYAATGGENDFNVTYPLRKGYVFDGWSITGMSTDCEHYWGNAGRGKNSTASGVTATAGFLNLRSTSGTVYFNATWKPLKYQLQFVFGQRESSTPGNYQANIISDEKFAGYQSGGSPWIKTSAIADFDASYNSTSKVYTSDSGGYRTITDSKYVFSFEDVEQIIGISVYSLFSELDPKDESRFAFSSYNIPFEIDDWCLATDTTNTNYMTLSNHESSGAWNLVQSDGKGYLESNNKRIYGNTSSAIEVTDSTSPTIIEYYAVYVPKEYNIYRENDVDFGRGSQKENLMNDNLGLTYVEDLGITWVANNGESVGDRGGYTNCYAFYASNEGTIQITLNNTNVTRATGNNAVDNDDYYIFDKIVLYNVGYKSENNYYYAQIEFVFNGSETRQDFDINVYKTGLATNLQGVSMNAYTKRSMYEDTELKYYFVDDSQDGVNGFKYEYSKVGDNPNPVFTLKFYNLGYAGNENDDDKTISVDSVTGKGKEGFKVKVYYKSNYTENDQVAKTSESKDGNFLQQNIIDVVNNVQLKHTSTTENYNAQYFWLNGWKVALLDSAGSFCNEVGYYKISSNELKKGGVYYTRSSNDFFARYASKINKNFTYENLVKNEIKDTDGITSISKKDLIYYDGTNIYYFGGDYPWSGSDSGFIDTNFNYTNYNSTEIIAIAPSQEHLNYLKYPAGGSGSGYNGDGQIYEMKTYLSGINLLGVSLSFDFNKNIALNGDDRYYYSGFASADDSKVGTDGYYEKDDYIHYLGQDYIIRYSYKYVSNNRDFILYFTERKSSNSADANKKTDNFIMYFIYTVVGSNAPEFENGRAIKIDLTFSDLLYDVKTNVSDFEDSYTSADTATVDYINYDDLHKTGELLSISDTEAAVNKLVKTEKINPTQLRVIKISPKNGYIIKDISVKLSAYGSAEDITLMNFSLYSTAIVNVTSGDDAFLSFVSSAGSGITFASEYMIKYKGTSKYLDSHSISVESQYNWYNGIYFTETATGTWFPSRIGENAEDYEGFETFYLLVGGIYGNVTVDVKTISYIEFDFNDSSTTNQIGFNNDNTNILRYKQAISDEKTVYSLDSKGESYLLKFEDKSSVITSSTIRYKWNGSKMVYTSDGSGTYVYKTPNSSEITDNGKLGNKGNFYMTFVKNSNGSYTESKDGKFILTDYGRTVASDFPYMDNNNGYMLKALTRLSMLISIDGTNKIKLGSDEILNDKLYDASFVAVSGNRYRVVFIGKSEFFKNGVEIFATGENYSAVFTSGSYYNDDGNDSKGLSNKAGTTAVYSLQNLTDFEGRQGSLAEGELYYRSIDRANVKYTDLLTYMKISNIPNFFAGSVFNRQGKSVDSLSQVPDYEFAEKYVLSVNILSNQTKLNINSYISNDILAQGYTDKQIDYSADDSVKGVNTTDALTIQSDNRNVEKKWAKSLTNTIQKTNVSPLMWLIDKDNKETCYQLDYVNISPSAGISDIKSNSWFNNTRLTNIQYSYNTADGKNGYEYKTSNWQSLNKSENIADVETTVENISVYGYGTSFIYYEIPGYYLDYIILETVDYGILYISLEGEKGLKGGSTQIEIDNGLYIKKETTSGRINLSGKSHNLYYKIEHITPWNGLSDAGYKANPSDYYYYTLTLYDEDEGDTDALRDIDNLNSIELVSNDITVSFFSKAHSGVITYHTNVESDLISSNDDLYGKTEQENFVYDTMKVINKNYLMDGYTFIGWGSLNYAEGETRFNADDLIWNASSSWIPMTGVSYKSGANDVSNINYFGYQNVDNLRTFKSEGYDFYVKSQEYQSANRMSSTGYFITDSGYSIGDNKENYNFWSAYADLFMSYFGDRLYNASFKTKNFNVDLYGIWKANVYSVKLNFNDSAESIFNGNKTANGTTAASLGLLYNPTAGVYDYVWNTTFTEVGGNMLENQIAYVQQNKLQQTQNKDTNINGIYYCFITFDKNNWFITKSTDVASKITDEQYSLNLSSNDSLLYTKNSQNMLQYVLDRYGYSWLGWFSEKLVSTYEEGTKFTNDMASHSNHLVLGSDYYYKKTSGNDTAKNSRSMPYLRDEDWRTRGTSDTYVVLEDFLDDRDNSSHLSQVGSATTSFEDIYSEFVYKGEWWFKNSGKSYVYHYDYMSVFNSSSDVNTSVYRFDNFDYLNGVNPNKINDYCVVKDGTALVYYDTALTLDVYERGEDGNLIVYNDGEDLIVKVVRKDRNLQANITDSNYRFITLYAHWKTNLYNVNIDYRDTLEDPQPGDTHNTIHGVGSTEVTNKNDIELTNKSDFVDSNDKTGTAQKSILKTYFDDNFYNYILNMSTPSRVGYDFVGWSFFYKQPQLIDTVYNPSTNYDKQISGDLFEYNGFNQASVKYLKVGASDDLDAVYYYTLDNSVIGNYTYNYSILKGKDEGGNDLRDYYEADDFVVLYNNNEWFENANGKYSYMYENLATSKFYNSSYSNTNSGKFEEFGDKEGDGNHHIFIFAMWRAQTFTINVNLNIDTENLINDYDQDSAYSIAFYESYNSNDEPQGYTGMNSIFLKQKDNTKVIADYEDVYAEVASNLTFVLEFDKPLSTAMFKDPNFDDRYYYLRDLFAVSSGYYLIDWLYESDDPSAKLMANTLNTSFGYNGALLKHNNEDYVGNPFKDDGSQTIQSSVELFDITLYNKLYNSNYKNVTGTKTTNLPFLKNASETAYDNYKMLKEINLSTSTMSKSTNFGYVTINGTLCYIETEYADLNSDFKTDGHNLYFRYNGVKYYALFYAALVGSGSYAPLTNDFSYLYYTQGGNKYIIRYDYKGDPYFVANNGYAAYTNIKYLDVKVAAFADSKSAVYNNIGSSDLASSNSEFENMSYDCITTRQFSIYAHWDKKDDMYISMTNGNNDIIYGEDSQKMSPDSNNPGLAGFYQIRQTGSQTRVLSTQDSYNVGARSVLLGEDIGTIAHGYTFYDDIAFDLVPFFNGRFLSELALEFDRIEDVGDSTTSSKAITKYKTIRYKILLNFEWDNIKHYMKAPSFVLYRCEDYDAKKDPESAEYELPENTNASDWVNEWKVVINSMSFVENEDALSNATRFILNSENTNYADLLSYLSVLDNISFNNSDDSGFFDRYDYNYDDPTKEYHGRRDVNMISFDMKDLLTSVYVTCKYAVQTYQINIHHIFDEEGDTLIQSSTDKSSYVSQYSKSQLTDGTLFDEENSLKSDLAFGDKTSTGMNNAIATVPINLNSDSISRFNVPYGYFIFGDFYSSTIVEYRPMDDYHRTDGGSNTVSNYQGTVNHFYDGFNYLYWEGNYAKGSEFRTPTLVLDGAGADKYADQGSPLLGSTTVSPDKSVRFNKSFYLFKGWFEDSGKTTYDCVVFDQYDVVDEATYISRNITLYGYYYSSNTPTNIQFYEWNNDWSEGLPAYMPYNNNTEEYTLSSLDEGSPFYVVDGYLLPNEREKGHIDSQGRAVLKTQTEFGVNSSAFSQDRFSGYEMSGMDIVVLNNILKTYWYYTETYRVMYAQNYAGNEKTYIKFDMERDTVYSYIPEEKQIVVLSEYLLYEQGRSPTYTILGEVDTANNKVSVTGGVDAQLMFDDSYGRYYFYDSASKNYYYFALTDRNSLMAKSIAGKNIFYYEDNLGAKHKVKIESSEDKSNVYLHEWDGVAGDYSANKTQLYQEMLYNYDFVGSELYALLGEGNDAKYYKYHKTPEDEWTTSSSAFIRTYKPRYYVFINGVKYYTMIQKENNYSTYAFTDLYKIKGNGETDVEKYNGSYNITTINNYFVYLNERYTQIHYEVKEDSFGSEYINPYVYPNTVMLDFNGTVKTYYFDYQNNSRTSGLYEEYNSSATSYSDKFNKYVLYEYVVYTPINQNYSLNAVLKNGYWESSDITLSAFPSINMGYWYGNPDYVLLGYINVSQIDLETMKRGADDEAVSENSDYEYVPELNQLVNKAEYEAYINRVEGATSYTVFADVNIYEQKITLVENGKDISLQRDTASGEYFFYYNENQYYFRIDDKNTVQIRYQQGGQIYSAFEDYIDERYSGDAYADLRSRLKAAIAGKIVSYGISDLIKNPLFVKEYQLSTIDNKTIDRVVMKITCKYILDYNDILLYGLEDFCKNVGGLAIEGENGTYTINVSAAFDYTFSLISKNTQIGSNIWAIPVYTPDVVRFVDSDLDLGGTEEGSVSIDGTKVVIDYANMDASIHDLETYRLFNFEYVWDLTELPDDATATEKAEREELVNAADHLQFVILTKAQYQDLMKSDSYDAKLNSIITGNDLDISNDLKVYSTKDITKANTKLSLDFSSYGNGDYYIFAFYYDIGTANNEVEISTRTDTVYDPETGDPTTVEVVTAIDYNKYVSRVSDNFVHVQKTGSTLNFSIEKVVMA